MKTAHGVLHAAPVPAVVSSLLYHHPRPPPLWFNRIGNGNGPTISGAAALLVRTTNRQDSAATSTAAAEQQQQMDDIDPQDLQYVSQIKTVTSSSSSYEIPNFISYITVLVN